jgi:hypothetical protein
LTKKKLHPEYISKGNRLGKLSDNHVQQESRFNDFCGKQMPFGQLRTLPTNQVFPGYFPLSFGFGKRTLRKVNGSPIITKSKR